MLEEGKWLIKTSTEEGLDLFKDIYEITVDEFIEDAELTRFEISDEIKAYVFIEYDGCVNQIIRRQEGEKFIVYGEGHYGCPINTSGMAVLMVKPNEASIGEQIHEWVIENSPYQIAECDSDWDDFDRYPHPMDVIAYEPMLYGLEVEEVVFVRQL